MSDQTAIKRPFSTTNRALAIALATVGVPSHESDGRQIPCLNSYTPEILRGIDTERARAGKPPLNLASLPIDEAIRLAHRAGEPGKVEYQFQATPTLHAILQGWGEQSAFIEAAERGDPNAQTRTEPLLITPEVAARLFCQYYKMGQEFAGTKRKPPLWKALLPLRDDSRIRSHGVAKSRHGIQSTGSVQLTSVKV